MDITEVAIPLAGAAVGALATYKVTENSDMPIRVASIAAGAVIGAAAVSFAYDFIQDNNVILKLLE